MLKKTDYKWHIVFIAVAVLLFSLICWWKALNNTELDMADYTASKTDRCMSLFEDNWNSAIVKKSLLSKIDSMLTYLTTGQISSNQVLKGKNDWLFYKSDSDGNPIADYEGTNSFPTFEKDEILESVLEVQNRVQKAGISFTIIVPPNKESVYYKYMPDMYRRAQYSRTDDLVNYLRNNGISIVSPKDELIKGTEDNQLYYSSDTHWNYLGAYIGLRETLQELNVDIPLLSDLHISKTECGGGDLAQLAGLGGMFTDTEYEIAEYKMPCCEEEQLADKVLYYSNGNAKIPGVLLLVGDSFRDSMIPALVNLFTEVYVVHRDCYSVGMLEEIEPDYVIMEYAERYSNQLSNMSTLIFGN